MSASASARGGAPSPSRRRNSRPSSELSEQQLRRFERGSSRLSPRQLLALSLRLGVGPGYLLEGAPAASAPGDAPEVIEMIQSYRAIRNDGMRRDLFLLVQAAARRSLTKPGREKPGVGG